MNEITTGQVPQPTKRYDIVDDDFLLHDFVLLIDLS